jgi:opacity protein-like surface antigen
LRRIDMPRQSGIRKALAAAVLAAAFSLAPVAGDVAHAEGRSGSGVGGSGTITYTGLETTSPGATGGVWRSTNLLTTE